MADVHIRVGRPDDAKVLTAYNVAMAKVRARLVAAILHLPAAARRVRHVAVVTDDASVVVKLSALTSQETEDLALDEEVTHAGVDAVLRDPAKGCYFLITVRPAGLWRNAAHASCQPGWTLFLAWHGRHSFTAVCGRFTGLVMGAAQHQYVVHDLIRL